MGKWNQLDHVQIIYTLLPINSNDCQHLIAESFTDQTLFSMPNQQCRSNKGNWMLICWFGEASVGGLE